MTPIITHSKLKSTWKLIAGVLISLAFLGLAFYQIDIHQLLTLFAQLRIGWVFLTVGLITMAYFTRSLLWFALLREHHQPNLWNLFRIITIGYLVNNLLPLKMGEILRTWLLAKREQLKMSLAIGTVVVERVIDLFALLFYFLLMMFVIPFAPWLKLSGLLLAGFGFLFLIMIIASYRFDQRILRIIETLLVFLPSRIRSWVSKQMSIFLEGITLMKSFTQLAMVLSLCLLTWFMWILVIYASMHAVGLSLPFRAAVFVIVVLNFGLMLPSSPGGLGVYEFMMIIALTTFGTSKELALVVGFTSHMLQYIVTLILGMIFIFQLNITMDQWLSMDKKVLTEESVGL
jgi:glycosyltransferase 2 family protein